MSKRHLYLLAFSIIAVAFAAMYYKWSVLKFPLPARCEGAGVDRAGARGISSPRTGANTVTLQLPARRPGFTVLDERFVARNYSKLEESGDGGREVQWAIRRALGEQDLYYRATIVRADDHQALPEEELDPVIPKPRRARGTLRHRRADPARPGARPLRPTPSPSPANCWAASTRQSPSEEVALLRERFGEDDVARSNFIVELLGQPQHPGARGLRHPPHRSATATPSRACRPG